MGLTQRDDLRPIITRGDFVVVCADVFHFPQTAMDQIGGAVGSIRARRRCKRLRELSGFGGRNDVPRQDIFPKKDPFGGVGSGVMDFLRQP